MFGTLHEEASYVFLLLRGTQVTQNKFCFPQQNFQYFILFVAIYVPKLEREPIFVFARQKKTSE